jgi:hypothetical protein
VTTTVDRPTPREIPWLDSLDQALAEAKRQAKLVLLDFFNPG